MPHARRLTAAVSILGIGAAIVASAGSQAPQPRAEWRYYGGDKGQGSDFAGTYLDENDDVLGWGYHPPGSSFKVYTLAAALRAGYSLRSYWEWQPVDLPGAAGSNRIRNSARCGELEAEDPTPCSLLQSTISSVNVPFYRVTLSVGAANVLATARDAGIEAMYTNDRERVDLTALEHKE